MKNQALVSSEDKSKKKKMSSAAIFAWRFKGLRCVHLPINRAVNRNRITTSLHNFNMSAILYRLEILSTYVLFIAKYAFYVFFFSVSVSVE